MQSAAERLHGTAAPVNNNQGQQNELLMENPIAQVNAVPDIRLKNLQTNNLNRHVDTIEQVIPDRIPLVKVHIGQRPIYACIDTSESVCTIRPEAVPLNAPREYCRVQVLTAAGATHPINQTCVLRVNVDGYIEQIRFFIYPLNFTMMTLGTDWMIKSKANLNLDENILLLHGSRSSLKMKSTAELRMTYYGQKDRHVWHPMPNTVPRDFTDRIRVETAAEGTNLEYLLQHITEFQQVVFHHLAFRIKQENHWPRYYVPARLRKIIIKAFHHAPALRNLDAEDIYDAMRIYYYWPGMKEDIASLLLRKRYRQAQELYYRPVYTEAPEVRRYSREAMKERVQRVLEIVANRMVNKNLQPQ